MKISSLHDNGRSLKFTFHGTTAQANTLRRAIITDVPCLAFDWITVHENTSCIPNELIAHRVGQVPIFGRGNIMNISNEEDRDWKNSVKFCVEVEGRDVLTDDMVVQDDAGVDVYQDIILCRLKNGQRLKLTAEATLNTGKTHSRWMPAIAVRCYPKVNKIVDNNNEVEEIVDENIHLFEFESTGAVSRMQILKDAIGGITQQLTTLRRKIVDVPI